MLYTAQLVTFLGRFPAKVDIPHERMFYCRKRSKVDGKGITSRWFANEFLTTFAGCILEYDPDITSRAYHLIAATFNDIEPMSTDENAKFLKKRTVNNVRNAEKVCKNVIRTVTVTPGRGITGYMSLAQKSIEKRK